MPSLVCVVCKRAFERSGTRGPIPKYCTPECGRVPHVERKSAYDKVYHQSYYAENRNRILSKGHEYNRTPEVRERNRLRMQDKWHHDADYRQKRLAYYRSPEYRQKHALYKRHRWATDPEYRERILSRLRDQFSDVLLPNPYTGHMWMDKIREQVGPAQLDQSAPWADYYNDMIGEAMLAFLEGRDPQEAAKEFRKREYVPQHLTRYISELKADKNGNSTPLGDWILPGEPSAEDEFMAQEEVSIMVQARHRHRSAKNASRHAGSKTSTPTNRKQNNK